ncbi:SPOR domain-containing protein [Marinilabiliaceae bacterium JC017]|nr:SPOR domain-containing protein [Marinilabiliaceae bacterium JC017]
MMHDRLKFPNFAIMKTVSKHITNLLHHHDCVIIPGLGGLVANFTEAQIDAERNIFTPPCKEIGFNRSLSHHDGLLINEIARCEGISYQAAKSIVEAFVTDVDGQIKDGKTASIDSVGELKQDAIGNIQFIPNKTESFLPDAFGLSSFHFSPVTPHLKPLSEQHRQVKRALRPLSKKQLAASIALFIGLFMFAPEIKVPAIHEQEQASVISFIQPEDNTQVSAAAYEPNIAKKTDVTENSEAITAKEQPDVYFLIAGSFNKESQAQHYLGKVQAQGQGNAFVLKSHKGQYRVALKGFDNKEQALSVLKQYRNQKAFSSVWMLTQR